ncbi:MAG TPA: PorP/SprF family type IX secretion system membrane protein [Bacteroidia bacterium]|nr:PorP/SprF family type IX secretion system membrane protein [Bacteroidia bacterium]
MKTRNLFFSLAILGSATLGAQDIHFSQITETPLLLNPSQAGLGHDIRASINYKDQWRSVVSAPYKTISASADFALLKKNNGTHLGVGINIFNDKAGDANMSTTVGQLHVAGILGLNSTNMLSVGVVAGYGQRNMNYSALSWGNQYNGQEYDPGLASGESQTYSSFNYLDIGAGVSWLFGAGSATMTSKDAKIFNIGIAVHHLNKPAYSFYGENSNKLPMKIVFHGNASIGMKNTNLILEPSYFVAIQGGHQEITPGVMLKYIFGQSSVYTSRKKSSALSFGAFFRVKDAIVPMLRYEFSNWSVATSYDINISGLTAASRARGGFEISIRFMTPNPFGAKTSRSLI